MFGQILPAVDGQLMEFYRATRMQHSADYAVARCLSVRVSVRLSHTGIESKRLHISSQFLRRRVAPAFWFSYTKRYGNILTGTHLRASNARGV